MIDAGQDVAGLGIERPAVGLTRPRPPFETNVSFVISFDDL